MKPQAVQEVADQVDLARGLLEEAAARSRGQNAVTLKEALEELDYAQEVLTTSVREDPPLYGAREAAIYQFVQYMEQTGRWDTVKQAQKLARDAVAQWRINCTHGGFSSPAAPIDIVLPQTGSPFLASQAGNIVAAPPAGRFERATIVVPSYCRDEEQAYYIALRQIEEALNLR